MAAPRRNDQYILDVDVVDVTGRVISVVELLGTTAESSTEDPPPDVTGHAIAAVGGGIVDDPVAVDEADYQMAEQAVPLEEESSARTLRQPRVPTAE